jgi:hypothetical protein
MTNEVFDPASSEGRREIGKSSVKGYRHGRRRLTIGSSARRSASPDQSTVSSGISQPATGISDVEKKPDLGWNQLH